MRAKRTFLSPSGMLPLSGAVELRGEASHAPEHSGNSRKDAPFTFLNGGARARDGDMRKAPV